MTASTGAAASTVRTTGLTATRLPPGPRLPVVAQTVLYRWQQRRWLPRLRRRYGDVVALRIASEGDVVVLSDVGHIRAVFAGAPEIFHAGEGNRVLEPVMGRHSVLLTDDEEHRRARSLLMPAFNGAALRGYADLIAELAEAEVAGWRPGVAFPVQRRMKALTLEIILRVVFGVTGGARLDELRRLLGGRERGRLGAGTTVLARIREYRRFAAGLQRVDELLYAEITERRALLRAGRAGQDVLTRLLTVPGHDDRLSDEELRDQLVTLLVAGHETTETALAWAMHELARDPARLAAATRAADEPDGDTYLQAVVKETMRLHAVVPDVARTLTRDIQVGEFLIPAGHTVLPSMLLVQRDPAHHDHPAAFRPERFLDGSPPAGSWFPFGGGVRRCLGAAFSLMEATTVLRAVLRRYHIAPAGRRPEAGVQTGVTIVPARGGRIVVTPRRHGTS